MDSQLDGLPSRIAYSFPEGTFDLRSLCPHAWFEADDGWTTAVRLGGHLPSLFRRLEHLGVILVSAQSGPVSLADTWERPSFQWVAHTGEFVELRSGAEVRLAALKTAMAVVQEVEDQQVASIQFFDAQGAGGLKLMMTNWSDLEFFEALVTIHARSREEGQADGRLERLGLNLNPGGAASSSTRGLGHRAGGAMPAVPAMEDSATTQAQGHAHDAATVRRLWSGLARSLPDSDFPGMQGLSRREGLAMAGGDMAWAVSREQVLRAVEAMAARGVLMGGAVRNGLAILPAAFRPRHWNPCGCGQTFFSGRSQFTLRRCCGAGEAWAVRFSTATDEVVCLEFYDEEGRFSGGLGLGAEATAEDHGCWRELVGEQ